MAHHQVEHLEDRGEEVEDTKSNEVVVGEEEEEGTSLI